MGLGMQRYNKVIYSADAKSRPADSDVKLAPRTTTIMSRS
jgi:hypothetical protein